jgi:hypothetical protein
MHIGSIGKVDSILFGFDIHIYCLGKFIQGFYAIVFFEVFVSGFPDFFSFFERFVVIAIA